MKIKLDENMPTALVPVLTELGHDVDTVPSEGIAGQDDSVVWKVTHTFASTHQARTTGSCLSGFLSQAGLRCSIELQECFRSKTSRHGPAV